MRKTEEEIRSMSDEEFWEYINKPNSYPLNEERKLLHFNTKKEYYQYYLDAISVDVFDRIIREKYGM